MPKTSSASPTERLALLLHLIQTFNSSLDLNEVLDRVLDEVIAALHAESGFVMLREANGRLTFPAARRLDQQTIEAPLFEISRGIVENVAQDGLPIRTSNAQFDKRFSGRASVRKLGLRSILCTPLKVKNKIIGAIYLENRLIAGIFTGADLDLLNTLSVSAAIAIENARLYQVAVEKGRIDRELEMTHRVQTSLLPARVPNLPGWAFAVHWQPAREVAGDYYDFISFPDGKIGLVIADVTDKGMPAALFMAHTHSAIRASSYGNISPAEGITRANHMVCTQTGEGLFVTLFFGLLDPDTGEMIYVNAGHNPPLFYSSLEGNLTTLKTTGMPLGIDADVIYKQQTIQMRPGDFVLFYTDGITEAINPQNMEFNLDRLQQAALNLSHSLPEEIIAGLLLAVKNYTLDAKFYDDITIMVVKRYPAIQGNL